MRIVQQRQKDWHPAAIAEPLKCVRDRPPPRARTACGVEGRRRQRVVRLQSHEGKQREPERAGRRIALDLRFAGNVGQRAGRHDVRRHLCNGSSGRLIADQPQGFGGASLDERRRIGQRRDERIAGARVPDQTDRERRHLPYFGVRIGKQPHERLHAFAQPDAADCERGAAPHTRFVVAQQAQEIGNGRRRWWWRRWSLAPRDGGRGHRRGGRRRGVAQHAPILETQDP